MQLRTLALLVLTACDPTAQSLPDASFDTDFRPPPPDASLNLCIPHNNPTYHAGTIATAQTWTAAASPHIISADLGIRAAVTIEPCATVMIAPNVLVTISQSGSLFAQGTAQSRINVQPTTGPWGQIRVFDGSIFLAHVNVGGGGAPITGQLPGAFVLNLGSSIVTQDVDIAGSQGVAINVVGGAGFDASSDLRIHGTTALANSTANGEPLRIVGNLATTVPYGNYTGNARDEVRVVGGTANVISQSGTLHAINVPYFVGDADDASARLDVGGPDLAHLSTLTIEAGTTIEFHASTQSPADNGLRVGTSLDPFGSLIAHGVPGAPIVFTSGAATPSAGDWTGIWFNFNFESSSLDQTEVHFAGRHSASGSGSCAVAGGNNDAAIRFINIVPQSQVVTNTKIADSARHGIDRGWTPAPPFTDFLAGNTFTNIPANACFETFPGSPGSCARATCPH